MFVPLNVKSHYSLLHSASKPEQIAKKCAEYGYTACALTDLNSVSGAVEFTQACKKEGIKPILGCDLILANGDNQLVLARNLKGWKQLIKIVSAHAQTPFSFGQLPVTHDLLYPAVEANNALFPIYYLNREDAQDQRLLLCSLLKTTFKKLPEVIGEHPKLAPFFASSAYFLPDEKGAAWDWTKDERDRTGFWADMCEAYDITGKPNLPKFECPEGKDSFRYLWELCEANKYRLNAHSEKYEERLDYEMGVIRDAELAGYFLIVQDYVNWAKQQGWLVGPGRGSVGGSLCAYLLGITTIDPLKYDLLFERFYNAGRNTKDHVSLPDIDVDFPISVRKDVIEYIKTKYGHDRVSQIATFGRLMGPSALKEVLRVHEACDNGTMNRMTKDIPDESKISDQLEESGETSIIRWVLENEPNTLKEFCTLQENGSLHGEYAQYFEQAIRLEGTYKSQGKHAAGIVIAAEPLADLCPMIPDKNGVDPIAAMEMEALEAMGICKADILGVAAFDKLMLVNKLLMTGKL